MAAVVVAAVAAVAAVTAAAVAVVMAVAAAAAGVIDRQSIRVADVRDKPLAKTPRPNWARRERRGFAGAATLLLFGTHSIDAAASPLLLPPDNRMNPKHFHTPVSTRLRCPVCHQPVYSRGGIHPQCAMRQSEPPMPKIDKAKVTLAGGESVVAVIAVSSPSSLRPVQQARSILNTPSDAAASVRRSTDRTRP